MMENAEVVFVPAPAIGHIVSMVELGKQFVTRYKNISVTVIVANFPYGTGVSSYVNAVSKFPCPRFKIIHLPEKDPSTYYDPNLRYYIFTALVDSEKPKIRKIALDITRSELSKLDSTEAQSTQTEPAELTQITSSRTESTRLAAFVVDMLSITIMDIANEFNVPTYIYSASSAGYLGLGLHLQSLRDDLNNDLTEFRRNSDTFLNVPSFSKPVVAKVLPPMLLDKEGGSDLMVDMFKMYREAKGVIVNSFVELEPYAFDSLVTDPNVPKLHSVGPIVNVDADGHKADEAAEILGWLDCQPPSSVLFMCFGSYGGFHDDQLKEMALALERSGHRFLWALRFPFDTKHSSFDDVLPSGFLERTAAIGKVIGWAPQVMVLGHNAVGGFVSHCGWNSIMESLWHGVPIATWPIYSEQQINAFEMVHELGLAVEIEREYTNDFSLMNNEIVKADEIEGKIRKLMLDENVSEIRKKVKKMKELGRLAVSENGSSHASLDKLIEEIVQGTEL